LIELALVDLAHGDAGGLHARLLEQPRGVAEQRVDDHPLPRRVVLGGRADQEVADRGDDQHQETDGHGCPASPHAGAPDPGLPGPTSPDISTNSRSGGSWLCSTSSGVPLTMILPPASIEMRSPIRNVDAMSWEITTDVTPKSSAVRRIISSTFLVA